MGLAYDLNFNCYYGYKEFFNYENLLDLYRKRDLIKNVVMNFGYIYQDVMMLYLGVPGFTEQDYFYYVMFYLADMFTRFFFRNDADPVMCWLPWNSE